MKSDLAICPYCSGIKSHEFYSCFGCHIKRKETAREDINTFLNRWPQATKFYLRGIMNTE